MCGIETAKLVSEFRVSCRNILSSPSSLFSDKTSQASVKKAVDAFNWPKLLIFFELRDSLLTSIEDQFKEEKYVHLFLPRNV